MRLSAAEQLLDNAGYTKIRHRRHSIWQCSCGRHTISCARTPSDKRDTQQIKSMIHRQACTKVTASLDEEKTMNAKVSRRKVEIKPAQPAVYKTLYALDLEEDEVATLLAILGKHDSQGTGKYSTWALYCSLSDAAKDAQQLRLTGSLDVWQVEE